MKNAVMLGFLALAFIFVSMSFATLNSKKPPKETLVKKEAPNAANPAANPTTNPTANPTSNPTSSINTPVVDNSISQVDSIPTSNYANPQLSYFYYIPQSVLQNKQARHPYLIMVPGLNGQGQDFANQTFKDFANREGFIIIAPSFVFDEKNWEGKTSYQYPSAWSGKAFNDIFNSFDSKQGMMPSRIYMLGFSAGAQFVARYALLYPDYVTACAVNAAGETDDPSKYQATKFYVAVGSQDEDDRKQAAQNFYTLAQKLGIDVTFKQYDNIGHQISDQEISDELAFFSKINAMDK